VRRDVEVANCERPCLVDVTRLVPRTGAGEVT
jgi:hypothetical protein